MEKPAVFSDVREKKLEKGISCLRYTLLCLNVLSWLCGITILGLCLWLRFDSGFQDWVRKLDIYDFYIGIYVLIFSSFFVLVVAFFGCASVLLETPLLMLANMGGQLFLFTVTLVGSGILLDSSSHESALQPIIRRVMHSLIHRGDSSAVLSMIQENIGCCGADGPNDYLSMRRALPSECRDTVTGNAFFYGCVEEVSWFLSDRALWVVYIALFLCLVHVINAVLSLVLLQALKKEEEMAVG